ncbi:MAG: Holliday junction resolvase RuvX [bacterium]|nr:Holliday junction resolvase RuvX [bacterium]
MIIGRILGIDYGTKRIGLAVSDDAGTIAFPKEILKNDGGAIGYLDKLIKTEEIGEIVIGESLDLTGQENKVHQKIKQFAKELEYVSKVKVFFQKEFMTSMEARRTKIVKSDRDKTQSSSRMKKEKEGKVDAKAAALILQRYLDKKNIKTN